MNTLIKKCVAEFIGTFTLVFFAVGTAVVTGNLVATAIAFGLVLIAMFYSIGNISGCHINPAVSIAMWTLGKMSGKDFVGYIIAQVVGALLASVTFYSILIMSGVKNISSFGVNTLIGGTYSFGSILGSFLLELILTFIFVYVICNVAFGNSSGKNGGIVIGLTLTLVHLVGINLTGTSVNPARSFGPALISPMFGGNWTGFSQLWIFIIAPLGGGIIAAIVFKILHTNTTEKDIQKQNSSKEKQDTIESDSKSKSDEKVEENTTKKSSSFKFNNLFGKKNKTEKDKTKKSKSPSLAHDEVDEKVEAEENVKTVSNEKSNTSKVEPEDIY